MSVRDRTAVPADGRSRTADPFAVHGRRGLPLRVESLTKRYGDHTVVDSLSFSAEPGRVTGFLGPNGSGKSTTMKILLGLAAATGGVATIGGRRYRDLVDPVRTVGAALETNAFHPGRSGRDHLRILADTSGVDASRVDETLELVGLTDAAHKRAGAYSLGMRQRLGLAGALLGDPPVLVLDEPSNGLDPQGVRTLRELLRARAARGDTVFVSSHLLGEVEHLADDVVVIDRGRHVVSGSLVDLQRGAALVRCSATASLRRILEHEGAAAAPGPDGALLVRGIPLDRIGDLAFREAIAIHELAEQAGSLEELFLTWTATAASPDVHTKADGR